ncbi:MAG TPA: S41 family peptidase [Bryobacteraceae bacterium]|nr:S41 family peptidase [Bryobacteraceae bacterium]
MAQPRRAFFVFPLIVLGFALLGGFYGPKVQVFAASVDTDPNPEAETLSYDRNLVDTVTKAYALVERNFAEPVNADKAIYRGAIPGMLRTLDPHSNFFDPKDYRALIEEQKGTYFGVGMQVASRNGKTVVIAPFPGSPAYKIGLRPGDIIVSVNDKPTENLNVTEVADILKGPRGTLAKIVVSRESAKDYLSFTVVRDEISRKSVPDAFWVKSGVAYLKILQFGESTGTEMDENLRRLGENNIKGLILDLRGNPGGLLNSGVAVADHFLQRGQLVVSHHGRSSAEHPYFARNGNHGRDYPIVVLVDRNSASAAEIVSGALQDHDRAWILGETTFGKGLVQTVLPMPDSTALALTTAHFYTPSGRLIQRDYTNKSFYDYYFHKDENARNLQDVKMTDSGRTVYGGGGITPDEKYTPAKLNKFQVEVLRKFALFNFSAKYFGAKADARLPNGWAPDESIVNDFHQFMLKNDVQFTEAEFTENHQWIKEQLKREMYITAFSFEDSRRVAIEQDPEIAQAIDALPKAKALIESAKKLLVQRVNQQDRQP